MSSKTSP
jgi:hypothetical protein